ncbi:cell envelope-associated transcriptional attenuator [Desulfocucumis palustris]|uniref:Cell envelope-associated transcriptional attenuator n=1 Tax=Desulfocucumis palustris TaxID=1898651 RepID=A0A2L2XN42_9FIRM|nr:LCP family protein [Desulfocucumis palustris]GBF35371.1 cell envelope-associated transcriptional attenuator [Desulfocucumis palustris]
MRHQRPKPRYKLKSKVRLVVLFVCLMLVAAGGYLWANDFFPLSPDDGLPGIIKSSEDEAYQGRKNILLLGMDARQGETKARTDTMMLASIDTEKNQLAVVSIPRDTRVEIPGHGMEKINSTTLYGGPELAMETVSKLVGVRVEDYVITNYDGFKEIIDALGGVSMDVEKRMYHYDPQDGGIYTIDLQPGVQRLDGEKALQFVRYRGYELGDISRTEYQQKFLTALAKEVMQAGTVLKLPKLLPKINDAVATNINLTDMVKLANAARKMTEANIVTQTLPGTFLDYKGTSFWSVDPDQAQVMVARLFDGVKTDKVVQGSTVVASSDKKKDENNNVLPGAVVPQEAGSTSGEGDNVNGGETATDNSAEQQPPQDGKQSNGNSSKHSGKGGTDSAGGGKSGVVIESGADESSGANGGSVTITPSQPQGIPGGIFPQS